MLVDLELYRREVRISEQPLVRLSAIDIAPDHPRRTFVFIHGYGGQATQWQYQLAEFGRENHVVALDMRGHGRSDKPPGRYSMPELLEDLERALAALRIDGRFVLAGHSFGGAVVTEYALRHPERLSGLILIATTGIFRLNPVYRFLLALPLSVLRVFGIFTRSWLTSPPRVLKPLHDNNLSRWQGSHRFAGLTVPALVIRGDRDAVFPGADFKEVTHNIPGAEEVNVGASGHMVMLERREAVNRAIERFTSADQQSWRSRQGREEIDEQVALLEDRPWLAHYDGGVPFTIAVPKIPVHHLLRSAVRRFPLRTALDFEGKRLTYRRLNHEANRFANALRNLGLQNGDRVMLLLPNLPQQVIGFYGTLKAGCVAVFTLPGTNRRELIRQIQDSGARVCVTLDQHLQTVLEAQKGSGLEQIILTTTADYLPGIKRMAVKMARGGDGARRGRRERADSVTPFMRTLYSQSTRSPDVAVQPDDLAAIIYTGGTTQQPKGVMLTHRSLVANALQTRHWIPEAEEGKEKFLCVLPFSHSYGLTIGLNLPISLAATLIIKPGFEVAEVLRTIRRTQPTYFPGVPNMYMAIKDYPGVRKYRVDSIKACLSGAAPLPVEVQEAFEKLTRGRLVEGYGLTEAGPATHSNPIYGPRKVGTIGIPLPSTEARVVDMLKPRQPADRGEIGELAVRGPQVMAGYWGKPEETAAVLGADGWLLTGDIVQMDLDGFFRVVARKADLWYPEKPGQPAFPRDVEEVIYEIPQVKEAAVVAIANQPIAFVISNRTRPEADSIIAYCQRRLPPSLVPKLVLFVDDFPRSFIGKILRRELKKRYEEQQSQRA